MAVAGIEPACTAYETVEIAKTSLPPGGADDEIRTRMTRTATIGTHASLLGPLWLFRCI